MKIIARPIEMVAWTDTSGNIYSARFKITKDDDGIFTLDSINSTTFFGLGLICKIEKGRIKYIFDPSFFN
jgi:hypothetical protein